jgi:hypothetical protein
MEEWVKQQRLIKQTDNFNYKAPAPAKFEEDFSFRISQPLEVDDFKSFLCLISDLEIYKITNREIWLKNCK